jgi:hypothetical protein
MGSLGVFTSYLTGSGVGGFLIAGAGVGFGSGFFFGVNI